MSYRVPKISARRFDYLVSVRRRGLRFLRSFSKKLPNSMAMAVKYRDAIVRSHPKTKIKTKALSNTGIVGISETTKWSRSRPTTVFSVQWRENGKNKHKNISFGRSRSRSAALAMAVKLRKEKAQ